MVTVGSDNPFRSVLFVEGDPEALAANPATGQRRLAVGTDHLLYLVDDAGVATEVGGGSSGDVATDAIWDAAGDLAVGSGADTAGRLPIGAVGGHLSRINGAVAWDSGTSNPGSAAAGDRYWRSDLGLVIYYDGTRWLTQNVYTMEATGSSLSASGDLAYRSPYGGADMWLVDFGWCYQIAATHDATRYWEVSLHKYEAGGATDTTIVTLQSAKTGTIWANPAATAIGALLGTTIDLIYFTAAKFSTVGNMQVGVRLRYRLVIT